MTINTIRKYKNSTYKYQKLKYLEIIKDIIKDLISLMKILRHWEKLKAYVNGKMYTGRCLICKMSLLPQFDFYMQSLLKSLICMEIQRA